VHPVWAWAIVHGHKRVENRTWRVRYRGPLAIHATAKHGGAEEIAARAALAALGVEVPAEIPRSAIVGTVTLRDIVPYSPDLADDPLATGPYCWLLEDVQSLRRVLPARGILGLWTITLD
jgi:hypothetical protein